jgi:hypothetical protein
MNRKKIFDTRREEMSKEKKRDGGCAQRSRTSVEMGQHRRKTRDCTCGKGIHAKRILISSGERNLDVARGCLRNRQNV